MVTKKKTQKNQVSNILITLGLVWILIAIISLLLSRVQESSALFLSLGIGSLITSLGICIKQASGYRWLPIFIVVGGALVTALVYLVYTFLYLMFVR